MLLAQYQYKFRVGKKKKCASVACVNLDGAHFVLILLENILY